MTLDYFYGQAGELFSFFRIPKALFQEQRFQDLSTDSAEVNEMVRTAKVTPEQLAALLRQSATATPNPVALSAVGATFEKEVDADED